MGNFRKETRFSVFLVGQPVRGKVGPLFQLVEGTSSQGAGNKPVVHSAASLSSELAPSCHLESLRNAQAL